MYIIPTLRYTNIILNKAVTESKMSNPKRLLLIACVPPFVYFLVFFILFNLFNLFFAFNAFCSVDNKNLTK